MQHIRGLGAEGASLHWKYKRNILMDTLGLLQGYSMHVTNYTFYIPQLIHIMLINEIRGNIAGYHQQRNTVTTQLINALRTSNLTHLNTTLQF